MDDTIFWSVVWGDWQSKLTNESTEYKCDSVRVFNDCEEAISFYEKQKDSGLEPTVFAHQSLAIGSQGVGVVAHSASA